MLKNTTKSEKIKQTLKGRKARGLKLGNPNPLPALETARQQAAKDARAYADTLKPLITALKNEGQSLRGIARELNRRGLPTLRGKQWQAVQIRAILARDPNPHGNPFLIKGPAIISFSGGRTSGFLLRKIIEAHGGLLPEDIKVVFANTGRERPETLDFIAACAENWNIPVVWLEYEWDAPHHTKIVDYDSASRNGEPCAALIERKKFLPNPVLRLCTFHLKADRIHAYARHWMGWKTWNNVVGLRHDEPRRVYKILNRCTPRSGPIPSLPLHKAGIAEADVLRWWKRQSFDLDLHSYEGNCDLCFLKGAGKLHRILKAQPDLADWWIQQEKHRFGTTSDEAFFRKDRPCYAELKRLAIEDQQAECVAEEDWENTDCACTD